MLANFQGASFEVWARETTWPYSSAKAQRVFVVPMLRVLVRASKPAPGWIPKAVYFGRN